MKRLNHTYGFCLVILSCAVVTACISLSPEQCRVADWKALGEKDGIQGREQQLAKHLKSCAPIGITPNTLLYRQGYQAGLALYCQPQHILDQALDGNGRIDNCPINKQSLLLPYYRVGRQVYEAKSNLSRLYREQDQLQRELQASKTTEQCRSEIRQILREQDHELKLARQLLNEAENKLSRFTLNR